MSGNHIRLSMTWVLRLLLSVTLFVAATAEEEKPAGIDLRELLKPGNPVEPFQATPLVPEWIGIVRKTGAEPRYIRLSHVGRETPKEDRKGRIWVSRMRSNGGYYGGDHANFYKTLPLASEVKQATKLARLRDWFGSQRGGMLSGTADEERVHWSEGWSGFTRLEDGNLRWLSVFAQVSSHPANTKNPNFVRVDNIQVSEGIFRPANADSAKERELYKTADEIHAAEGAAQEAKRASLPQPLRDLVAADEAPDDSDLAIYSAALSAIRKNPDPELFRQIAALDDTGTGRSYLRDILFDAIERKTEAWDPEKKKLSVRHAIDALPGSPNERKLHAQVIALIGALGGGHMKIDSPRIDLDVTNGGSGYTQSGWDVENENLPQAIAAVSAWLRSKL